MKRIDNRWTRGKVDLKFPPPDPALIGRQGVLFQRSVFDPKIGAETYLLILDERRYAAELGDLPTMDVKLKPALVRTSAGALAVLIWQIGSRGRQIVTFEQYINPFGSLEFLTTAAAQTELKVIVGDNRSGEVMGFFPIANNYELDIFVDGIREVIREERPCDFSAAQRAFVREFTIEEILNS